MLPNGRKETYSFPPDPRPPAESRDQTEKEQNWWPTICLKGAFWSLCKYNYRADPEPTVAFESCQFPIRFWQTLLEFRFDRSKPPLAYQCPPPLTSSLHQAPATGSNCDSAGLKESAKPPPKWHRRMLNSSSFLEYLSVVQKGKAIGHVGHTVRMTRMPAPCLSSWEACWGLIKLTWSFRRGIPRVFSLCSILHFVVGWHHSAVKIFLETIRKSGSKPVGMWILFISKEYVY